MRGLCVWQVRLRQTREIRRLLGKPFSLVLRVLYLQRSLSAEQVQIISISLYVFCDLAQTLHWTFTNVYPHKPNASGLIVL